MYKVGEDKLNSFKDSLIALSTLLTMSINGKKLHKKEVDEQLNRADNLIHLIKNNYGGNS